jgi:propionyl-CoA carboxylase alpha chain
MDIPVHYDPLLAKLVVHAPDRPAAIARMKRALDEFEISGPATTLDFGRWVMEQSDFVEGRFDTGFIAKHFRGSESLDTPLPPWEPSPEGMPLSVSEQIAVAAIVLRQQYADQAGLAAVNTASPPNTDAWHQLWKNK